MDLSVGIVQGSPLCMILFVLYNNEILELTRKDKMLTSLGYADDISLLAADKNPLAAAAKLERLLPEIENWAARHGCEFDRKKTQMIALRRLYLRLRYFDRDMSLSAPIKGCAMRPDNGPAIHTSAVASLLSDRESK